MRNCRKPAALAPRSLDSFAMATVAGPGVAGDTTPPGVSLAIAWVLFGTEGGAKVDVTEGNPCGTGGTALAAAGRVGAGSGRGICVVSTIASRTGLGGVASTGARGISRGVIAAGPAAAATAGGGLGSNSPRRIRAGGTLNSNGGSCGASHSNTSACRNKDTSTGRKGNPRNFRVFSCCQDELSIVTML